MNPFKIYFFSLLILASLFCIPDAYSQQAPDEEPFFEEEPMPMPPPPHRMEHFTRRWMDTLRQENPEQYQKFMALRDEDPDAFRDQLSAQLDRKRMQECLKAFPAINDCYTALSEDEQTRMATACFARPPMMRPPEEGASCHAKRNREGCADRKEAMKNFHALIGQYKQTDDPATREALHAQILTLIGRRFDERTEERKQHLQQLSGQLDIFREKLDQRVKNRDQIIEERFERLISTEQAE